jgi:tryptophan-rich sensory protein
LILGTLPFPFFSKLAGFYGVALQVFQRNDRGSAWLAFGLAWVICAITALASAYLVFQVAETRKRLLGR